MLQRTATLARDLQLLEYTKGKMHIPFISCATSVELIRAAKKKGLNTKLWCWNSTFDLYRREFIGVQFRFQNSSTIKNLY